MARYEIVVGNIGTVYSGDNRNQATGTFNLYVDRSLSKYGLAAGEPVTMMVDGEPAREYAGTIESS